MKFSHLQKARFLLQMYISSHIACAFMRLGSDAGQCRLTDETTGYATDLDETRGYATDLDKTIRYVKDLDETKGYATSFANFTL